MIRLIFASQLKLQFVLTLFILKKGQKIESSDFWSFLLP